MCASNYPKEPACAELSRLAKIGIDREREEREELTKRYSVDEKELEAYERGFSEGYRCGLEDGWAKGFDEGLRQAFEERKMKEEEKEEEEEGGDSK
jgi:flagellar biosynthesis/type III secretory pathway protein FliH